jgi:hypothetical protein
LDARIRAAGREEKGRRAYLVVAAPRRRTGRRHARTWLEASRRRWRRPPSRRHEPASERERERGSGRESETESVRGGEGEKTEARALIIRQLVFSIKIIFFKKNQLTIFFSRFIIPAKE